MNPIKRELVLKMFKLDYSEQIRLGRDYMIN